MASMAPLAALGESGPCTSPHTGLPRRAWTGGTLAVALVATAGMAASALAPSEGAADVACALACGVSLSLVGGLLVAAIVSGGWSVRDDCARGRDAGYGLAGAATVCVVLLVVGLSALALGLGRLAALLG